MKNNEMFPLENNQERENIRESLHTKEQILDSFDVIIKKLNLTGEYTIGEIRLDRYDHNILEITFAKKEDGSQIILNYGDNIEKDLSRAEIMKITESPISYPYSEMVAKFSDDEWDYTI